MRFCRARGFTLIELMIAIAISLIILLAVSQVYLASNDTQRSQTDATRLNENGRFALALVSDELRKAGLHNIWAPGVAKPEWGFCNSTTLANNSGPAFVGCNDQGDPYGATPYANFNPRGATTAGNPMPSMTCNGPQNGAKENGSDVLRVRYYGENVAPTQQLSTGAVLDCFGNAVPTGSLVTETLFIGTDTNTKEPALFCHSTNSSNTDPQPLVEGVESMQLLYGEDTDMDGTADRYVPWHKLLNPDHVVSITASFVLRSPNSVAIMPTNAAINMFGATYASIAEANGDKGSTFAPSTTLYPAAAGSPPVNRRLRGLVTTEVVIKNHGTVKNSNCE